uniref:Capsid protein n=1 Tax=Merch tombus-like virus TaxID=2716735 RepID=A0A6G7PS36_9TOMB|nr:hypothetical protein [Merch tombus-like virus]
MMNRTVKNLLKAIAPASNGGRSKAKRGNQKPRGVRRRTLRRIASRTVNNPSWGRSLPAAYASHVRPRFNVRRQGDSVVVSGCDLVYSIPTVVASDEQPIFTVIPSNPAYWLGTRIGQLAPAYMNYRPLSVTFSYIPQVAVTQAGTVFMGTLWNGAPGGNDIQQTLVTSNGGCLTQCYVPADTRIKLGANLQQNLFTLSGDINPDTSPFIFMAGLAGATVTPGYFYVTYVYEFKNPIGMSWVYNRQYLDDVTDLTEQATASNASIVLTSSLDGYGPGTVLDLESGGGVYYHGSSVDISDGVNGYLFTNSQEQSLQNRISTINSDLTAANSKIDGLTADLNTANVIQSIKFTVGGSGATVPLADFTKYDKSQSQSSPGIWLRFNGTYWLMGYQATLSPPSQNYYWYSVSATYNYQLLNSRGQILGFGSSSDSNTFYPEQITLPRN